MKFSDFLNEQKIDERVSTNHGKVEMSLRELDIKYDIKKHELGQTFSFLDKYSLVSLNSGIVTLYAKGIKGELGSVNELDFGKIRISVTKLLKDKVQEIKK